jgi:hypothetical protein
MKYAIAALALAALARAQSRDDIPKCALPCLDDAITSETNCDVSDYACVCPNFSDIQSTATGCVVSECGAETALNEVCAGTKISLAASTTFCWPIVIGSTMRFLA